MRLSDFVAQYADQDIEIGQQLEKVSALAQALDRSGKVVVTFNVAKANSRVAVTVAHKTVEPQSDPELGLFHVTAGGLTKNDPNQFFDRNTGEITPNASTDT